MRKLIILLLIAFILFGTTTAYGTNVNPSREELEKMITEVAHRKGVPSVILMSIARVETVFQHYDSDGTVSRGSSGSIGLMQIHNNLGYYDENRLMNDINYNIEIATDILIGKWDSCVSKYGYLPSVGDMNPNVLENWYFALWGYNSFVSSNNPNVAVKIGKRYTYQDLIYKVAENEYNQPINNIDYSYLPMSGLPSKTLNVPTPAEFHYGDIQLHATGQRVQVDTNTKLNLRESPDGNIIGELKNGDKYIIGKEAVLQGGYYWYYLLDGSGKGIGWAARNWLVHIDDGSEVLINEDGTPMMLFTDIEGYWGKEYIIDLFNNGIINGLSRDIFAPNEKVTKEQFALMLCRSFDLEPMTKYEILDRGEVSSWARTSVDTVISHGIMSADDGNFYPREELTRIEAALAISKILKQPDILKAYEFEDVNTLSPSEQQGLDVVYTLGIMNGKSSLMFDPDNHITRGEISKILYTTRSQFHQ